MGFKVNVQVNGASVGEIDVDVKPEHVFDATLQAGGSTIGSKVSREASDVIVNLGAHLEAAGVLVDDVLAEKEQEKRDRIEGGRTETPRPRPRKVTAKRVSSPRRKSTAKSK